MELNNQSTHIDNIPEYLIREEKLKKEMDEYNIRHKFTSYKTGQPNYTIEDYYHENKKRYNDSTENEQRCNLNTILEEKKKEINSNKPNTKILKFAKLLHDNCDKMDNENIKNYVVKCLSKEECANIVYDYILTNYMAKSKKYNNIKEFTNDVLYYLNNYQTKMINVMLEDEEWIVYNHESTEYNLDKNQVLFENTIDRQDTNDRITMDYINKLVNFLNNLSKNINVTLNINNKCATNIVCIKCKLYDK